MCSVTTCSIIPSYRNHLAAKSSCRRSAALDFPTHAPELLLDHRPHRTRADDRRQPEAGLGRAAVPSLDAACGVAQLLPALHALQIAPARGRDARIGGRFEDLETHLDR